MPTFRPTPDLVMHYEVDDFTDPWRQPETILLLHGNAESGLAWYGWVPALARHYRVVRPDMRGFGQSTPMPCFAFASKSRSLHLCVHRAHNKDLPPTW